MQAFRLFLISASIMLLGAFSIPALSSDLYGRPVKGIIFKDEHGAAWPESDGLLPLLATQPGAAFSSETIRKDIQYLYLKGLFRDIRVGAFPEDDGVVLVYTLFPETVVDAVRIHGCRAVSRSRIKEIVSKMEGRPLRENLLPEVRIDIMTLYQAEGYFDVDVGFRKESGKRPYRIILHVEIEESKPTLVEKIEFRGNKRYSDDELLSVMKTRIGRPIKRDVLFDEDLEAIKRLYADAGYPAASLSVVDMNFKEGKAYITLSGNEGPRVDVDFRGNKAISSRRLAKGLLIWSEHDVSDSVLESSADKIRDMYRAEGYADVRVEVKKRRSDDSLHILFDITEGPRVTVSRISIAGNTLFSDKELKKGMRLRESGRFISRPYVDEMLDKDIETIKYRYIDAGFLDVSVKAEVQRSADRSRASIDIIIAEGVKTVVGVASFEGNIVFSSDDLIQRIKQRHGMGFSERLLEEDKYNILSAYSQMGYIYAAVSIETREALQPTEKSAKDREAADVRVLDVIYKIKEDRPVSIGKIILRGNRTTKDHVIIRELSARPGDKYNYEEILRSQQRIYRLGYFGLARLEPLRSGEKEYVKDLLLTVEERPAGAVDLRLGYGDLDRFRAGVEISHRNIGGSARTASLRLENSDILQRVTLGFQEPWFLNRRLESRFTMSWSDSDRINVDTREVYYQTRKSSAAFGVEHVWKALKTSLVYQYENVENYNVQPGAVLSPEDEGRVRISSLSPGAVLDMRDDPFNPKRGSLHGIAIKEAMSGLGSEADFTKATLQSSWFFPLSDKMIAALSLRAGMAWPHRDTREIPLHERFYAGGGTTIRGYLQDLVGPTRPGADGQPVPTGGEAMVVGNIELRINPTGNFGLVLFADAGNVWQERTIRIDDLRASYGIGIRYNTPVGPFRLDYGQKINRRPGESPGELHFSLGHAF